MLPMWLPHKLPLRSCINFKYILFASSSIISILCHPSLHHHHQTFLFAPAQWYVNVHDSFPYWFLKFKKKKKKIKSTAEVSVEFGYFYFCYSFLFGFYLVWILCKLFTILLILIIWTLAFHHYPFFLIV